MQWREAGNCRKRGILCPVYHIDVTVEQVIALRSSYMVSRHTVCGVGSLRSRSDWPPQTQTRPTNSNPPRLVTGSHVRRCKAYITRSRPSFLVSSSPHPSLPDRPTWNRPPPLLSSSRSSTHCLRLEHPLRPFGRHNHSLPIALGQRPSTRSADPTSVAPLLTPQAVLVPPPFAHPPSLSSIITRTSLGPSASRLKCVGGMSVQLAMGAKGFRQPSTNSYVTCMLLVERIY